MEFSIRKYFLSDAREGVYNYVYSRTAWLRFSLKTIVNFPQIFKYRAETFTQMNVLGNKALPLVVFAMIFISMAAAIEWTHQAARFGAESMMGGVLSKAILRSICPVVIGLVLAGRTSAEVASEIGHMVLTNQIDALRAFGIDPIKRLISARVFASMLVMLPLTILADTMGIIAAWFAAVVWSGIDPQYFWVSALNGLLLEDLYLGLVKPLIYGLLIGLISSYLGYSIQEGTGGIGRRTIKAVTYSSVGVLIAEFLLTELVHAL